MVERKILHKKHNSYCIQFENIVAKFPRTEKNDIIRVSIKTRYFSNTCNLLNSLFVRQIVTDLSRNLLNFMFLLIIIYYKFNNCAVAKLPVKEHFCSRMPQLI